MKLITSNKRKHLESLKETKQSNKKRLQFSLKWNLFNK